MGTSTDVHSFLRNSAKKNEHPLMSPQARFFAKLAFAAGTQKE
jgi:hypothetical protein